MNQLEFDNGVLAVAGKHIDIMTITADLRRQGDPESRRLEEEQIFVQNVLSALQDYDVTSDLLSDDDISYLFELATGALQTCP
jgi:hypothetical protein